MTLRDWFEQNTKAAVTLGVTVLLLIVVAMLYCTGVLGSQPPTSSGKFYFYDMQTEELFAAEQELIPPIKAPSGGEGVLAQVYDCGECDGEHFVSMLTKYTDKAKQAIEKDLPPPASGELIRRPDSDSDWVPADSDEAAKMRSEAAAAVREFCQGASPKICFPK